MEKVIIFGNYEVNKVGEVKNINTGKSLNVKEINGIKKVYLTIEGKSKLINLNKILEENFGKVQEEEIVHEEEILEIEEQEQEQEQEQEIVNEEIKEEIKEEVGEEEKVIKIMEEFKNGIETLKLNPPKNKKGKRPIQIEFLDGTIKEYESCSMATKELKLKHANAISAYWIKGKSKKAMENSGIKNIIYLD